MEAHEAVERFEKSHHAHHEGDNSSRNAAFVVAVIAAILAVSTFMANEAVKDAIQGETKVADARAEYQTQLSRQIELQFEAGTLFSIAETSAGTASKAALDDVNKAATLSQTTAKKIQPAIDELKLEAGKQTKEVNHANDRHLRFELSVVGLQIGIVLASVSILARRRWLLIGGGLMGIVGLILLALGFAI
jgi:2-oxoglutarate dehydrogenase complex dehydrogenase (E1) component-like enzyme